MASQSAMFRSFESYNFRLWFFGSMVSNIGALMQTTAQSWVVLVELTDGDARAMGLTIALQFIPQVFLVGVAGWVSDRFDRWCILVVTQVSMLFLSGALGALLLLGAATLPLMFIFALAFGVVSAFDLPARQVFVTDLVPMPLRANAVALNAASFNSGRLIGPAAAGGAILFVGTGWLFVANAVTFVATLSALMLMRREERHEKSAGERRMRLLDGFRYVAMRGDLLVVFAVAFLVGLFSMNFSIFASTMALEFGVDVDGFGLLTSLFAVGSLLGALGSARMERPRLLVSAALALLLTVAVGTAALVQSYWLFGGLLALCGLCASVLFTTVNGYTQVTAPGALRGRVLSIYLAVVLASAPAGGLFLGAIADSVGPRAAVVVASIACFAAFVVLSSWMLISRRAQQLARGK